MTVNFLSETRRKWQSKSDKRKETPTKNFLTRETYFRNEDGNETF
jgi:hypothetical protein